MGLRRMLEVAMAAGGSHVFPTVGFDQSNQVTNLHCYKFTAKQAGRTRLVAKGAANWPSLCLRTGCRVKAGEAGRAAKAREQSCANAGLCSDMDFEILKWPKS